MLVGRVSQISGKYQELDLDVTQEQLDRFEHRVENGEYVQTIFPNLSAGEREFLKSGITPKEWTDQFGSIEDMMGDPDNDLEFEDERYVDENER